MRFRAITSTILALGIAMRTLPAQEAFKYWEKTQVEFYITGRVQVAPKYRVKSFRQVGPNSPELAARFRGLAAQGLESGDYVYELEPEKAPPGPPGAFNLSGTASLYGPFPYLVTLQVPTGSSVEGASFIIKGRVVPAPNGGGDPFWIRFQHAVDLSQVIQKKLSPDGIFEIPYGPLSGDVVVTICRGGEVLLVDVVHFTAGRADRPLEFQLQRKVRR